MHLIRRYWAAALIMIMVAVHAAVIGYVRSRVARMNHLKSNVVELGTFRFQPIADPQRVIEFRLHASVDPSKRVEGEEYLTQMRMEILEESEQMLRQVDPTWLNDPSQVEIRERLLAIVVKQLPEALVQRVLITGWMETHR